MNNFDKIFGNRGNSVSAGRDIKDSTIIQDSSIHIGDNGPTCPFNWQIGFGTCGCCPKSNGCEKWQELVERTNRNLGKYY